MSFILDSCGATQTLTQFQAKLLGVGPANRRFCAGLVPDVLILARIPPNSTDVYDWDIRSLLRKSAIF
jgi:hypothetical protein